ncbi:hypothetical protein HaLaN_15942, partial [Haematococcus lacustris]
MPRTTNWSIAGTFVKDKKRFGIGNRSGEYGSPAARHWTGSRIAGRPGALSPGRLITPSPPVAPTRGGVSVRSGHAAQHMGQEAALALGA